MKTTPVKGNPRKNQQRLGANNDILDDIQQHPKKQTIKQVKQENITREKRKKRAIVQNKRSKRKKVSKLKIFIIILIIVLISAIGSLIYFYNSNTFQINEIEYIGTDHLTEEECKALAPVDMNSNLLNFNADKIKAGFMRDSWIKSISFERCFPHKLKIIIEEKTIGAVVDFTAGANQTEQSWFITNDGTWLMAIPSADSEIGKNLSKKIFEDSENSIHIKDVPFGISPVMGSKSTDEVVLNALNIITGFTTSLKDNVKTISSSNINATSLILKNNIEIAFGQASQIRDKERIVNEIMQQNPKVVYINVRSVERPTWRAA